MGGGRPCTVTPPPPRLLDSRNVMPRSVRLVRSRRRTVLFNIDINHIEENVLVTGGCSL